MSNKQRKIKSYNYDNTVSIEYWQNYLQRHLTKEEYFILKQAKCEKTINDKIKKIYNICSKNNMYIPMLTNMHGNCIFESLQYFKLCDDIDNLRKGIANIMIMFKDKKNFLPNQEMSLSELFSIYNEIEYVYCRIQKKLYKYNFDAMCIDLANDCSWTRLNTELIFTVMSLLLNLKFFIFHDNGHVTKICSDENDNTLNIYLGLIDEFHYFPIDMKSNDTTHKCPFYLDKLMIFHKWAKYSAIVMKRVIYETESESENDTDTDTDNNSNDSFKEIKMPSETKLISF